LEANRGRSNRTQIQRENSFSLIVIVANGCPSSAFYLVLYECRNVFWDGCNVRITCIKKGESVG